MDTHQLDNQAPLLQQKQENVEQQQELLLQTAEKQGFLKLVNINQLKSFDILKSAVKNLTSNPKFTLFMIISLLPLFASILFLEIKITQVKNAILQLVVSVSPPVSYLSDFDDAPISVGIHDENDSTRKIFDIIFYLFPFYLILFPLIELFSLTTIIKLASKKCSGEVESTTLHDIFYKKNNLKVPFVTSLWVQLFSTCTLVGLFWAVINHFIVTNGLNIFGYYTYDFSDYVVFQQGLVVNILSIGFHGAIFLGLLNKYLDWSVTWNLGIVISVLEEESGIDALDFSGYYGRTCKRTGFELMLGFFAYSVVLRLPFVLAQMYGFLSIGVVEIAIISGLVCLGSLVKWVAFVLYYYECKTQVLIKKVDEELGVGDAHL